jgi:glycerate kinase
MRILIAPDKFKGSLSAREVAENIALGLRDILTNADIDIVPMADGGEGTAEVVCQALQGEWMKCNAHDPLGREIECRYAYIDNRQLAVMEMSEAAGMRWLAQNERDPLRATTVGVGEMILDAGRRGASEIIVGLGGSATNDGGFGMARALGFLFFADGQELAGAVSELRELSRIESPKEVVEALATASASTKNRRLTQPPLQRALPKIVAAADVRNPLLGENGATRVFGPQKGATDEKIEVLERVLVRLADIVANEFGFDFRNEPGAGAAGGLGFGLMSFCGANIRPGFDLVAEAVDLKSKIKNVDVVITGEGSLDRQTLQGKAPAEVAKLARERGKHVYAIVGRGDEGRQVREIFDGVVELAQPGTSEPENMKRAAELLREKARELAANLKKTFNVQR